MDRTNDSFETLKQILRQVQHPEQLDDHPWTRSRIVRDALNGEPNRNRLGPGQQLINAIVQLFRQMQPAVPPRRGKRLDPRWGEFGLMAALYFAPLDNGSPFPTSLMDAWGRIDPAILHFVYGKPAEELSEEEIQRYQLVGDELEYGSVSTLSDWHKKGLQRLNGIILNRERFLDRDSGDKSKNQQSEKIEVPDSHKFQDSYRAKRLQRRYVWLSLAMLLLLALGLGAFKTWRVYQKGMLVYHDVYSLQELMDTNPDIETLAQAAPRLDRLDADLTGFKREAGPFLFLSPWFGWVPVYGYDIVSAPVLIEMAEHLLSASRITSQALHPLLDELDAGSPSLDVANLTTLLVQAQPQFEQARNELDKALSAWKMVDVEQLSPKTQGLLVGKLEPVLGLFDEGLSLVTALPDLLGAGKGGTKTYLLLAQNEDELRPTGGFITSVGNLVLHNGQMVSMQFEEAGEQEDWSKPYPSAPWQLQEYMNSPVLVLRDSNWFTDYPTAALWAEYLYAYTHAHSVDGVIAFDQHFLIMLLGELGPLDLEDAPYPVTDENVVEYMRRAKIPPPGESVPTGWYRKEFIGDIANAIMTKIIDGEIHDWREFAGVVVQALDERHLLLQLDNPSLTELLVQHDWDNAVHPGTGDFLMVVDTNIGFNKTNAVVDVSLAYDVDLTDTSNPVGTLLVTHKNSARSDIPCIQWNGGQIAEESEYPIDRCYWDYLRVYKQKDVELTDASLHSIAGELMILGHSVPARVDEISDEIPGVQGFGTLLVVPGGKSVNTMFQFSLPDTVVVGMADQMTYHLSVRKQPGTLATPLTLRIHLPNRAILQSVPMDAVIQDENLLISTDLRTNFEVDITFNLP